MISNSKKIGFALIAGSVLVLIPYTILTIIFDYPNILREDTGVILTAFHNGGKSLIFVWWLFAITGLPLLYAYVLIGQALEKDFHYMRFATILGVISGITQIVGLLRWTFVVPVLANSYVHAADDSTRSAIAIVFQAVHQFGGVLLGEYIGQFFTIAWTVLTAMALGKAGLIPKWTTWFAYVASAIYFLAQLELFATVIPGFPAIDLAGFIGSTLWLVWLILIGIRFVRLPIHDEIRRES